MYMSYCELGMNTYRVDKVFPGLKWEKPALMILQKDLNGVDVLIGKSAIASQLLTLNQ